MSERPDDTYSGQDHEIHPERVVDELEEKVLGERSDQRRRSDETPPRDEDDETTEPSG